MYIFIHQKLFPIYDYDFPTTAACKCHYLLMKTAIGLPKYLIQLRNLLQKVLLYEDSMVHSVIGFGIHLCLYQTFMPLALCRDLDNKV